MDWWFLALLLCGCYSVGDGIGSIMEYWHQTLLEHVPRIIRSGLGSFSIYLIFLLFNSDWLLLTPVCVITSAIAGGYLGLLNAKRTRYRYLH